MQVNLKGVVLGNKGPYRVGQKIKEHFIRRSRIYLSKIVSLPQILTVSSRSLFSDKMKNGTTFSK